MKQESWGKQHWLLGGGATPFRLCGRRTGTEHLQKGTVVADTMDRDRTLELASQGQLHAKEVDLLRQGYLFATL